MKYSVNSGRISSFVKIVNFVGRAGSEYGLPMAVTRKCRRKLSTAEPPADDGIGHWDPKAIKPICPAGRLEAQAV